MKILKYGENKKTLVRLFIYWDGEDHSPYLETPYLKNFSRDNSLDGVVMGNFTIELDNSTGRFDISNGPLSNKIIKIGDNTQDKIKVKIQYKDEQEVEWNNFFSGYINSYYSNEDANNSSVTFSCVDKMDIFRTIDFNLSNVYQTVQENIKVDQIIRDILTSINLTEGTDFKLIGTGWQTVKYFPISKQKDVLGYLTELLQFEGGIIYVDYTSTYETIQILSNSAYEKLIEDESINGVEIDVSHIISVQKSGSHTEDYAGVSVNANIKYVGQLNDVWSYTSDVGPDEPLFLMSEGETKEFEIEFNSPIYTTPTFVGSFNSQENGLGADVTQNISYTLSGQNPFGVKLTIVNNSGGNAYCFDAKLKAKSIENGSIITAVAGNTKGTNFLQVNNEFVSTKGEATRLAIQLFNFFDDLSDKITIVTNISNLFPPKILKFSYKGRSYTGIINSVSGKSIEGQFYGEYSITLVKYDVKTIFFEEHFHNFSQIAQFYGADINIADGYAIQKVGIETLLSGNQYIWLIASSFKSYFRGGGYPGIGYNKYYCEIDILKSNFEIYNNGKKFFFTQKWFLPNTSFEY